MAFRRWKSLISGTERRDLLVVIALFLFALLLRLYRLDAAPPGLNGDEVYNIIDARRITLNNLPVFIPGNQGREALYFYLLALSLRLFGTTILALRLPSVLLGGGTVILAYVAGRDLFGRREGLVAAGLIAVSFWPLMLSRMGLRAISLTFLTTLTTIFYYRALRDGRRGYWVLSGLSLGLTLYTYIPARVFPLVILVWMAWIWWRRREQLRRHWRAFALSLLLAAIVAAPFAIYMVRYPEQVNQRIESMTNAVDRALAGEPEALLASVGGVVKMFSIEGDEEWRYHLAHRPVFDPITSIFFYLGLGITVLCAFRARAPDLRQPECALLLVWTVAMLAPNAVLNENPSFIRAAGAIVPVYLLVGIGVQRVWQLMESRLLVPSWTGPLLLGIGLAATLAYTLHSYFNVWNNHPQVRVVYHAEQAMIGRYLDENKPPAGARIFVASDYVYDSPTALSMSLFTDENVAWFAREDTFPWSAGSESAADQSWYLIPAQQQLPPDVLARLEEQADEEMHRFSTGELAFINYQLPAAGLSITPQHEANLTFEPGLRLVGYDTPREAFGGDTIAVRLYWRIADGPSRRVNELTYVQLHLADAGGLVRARAEALLGYPQAGWESGDRFIQDIEMALPAGMPPGPTTFAFGLRNVAGQPLGAIQEAGDSAMLVRARPLDDFSVTPDMSVFDDTLVLSGAVFRPLVTPGTALNVELNWVALTRPTQAYRVQLQLVDARSDETVLAQTFDLLPEIYPPTRWNPLEAVTTLHGFRVPVDAVLTEPLALHVRLLPAIGQGNQPLPVTGGAFRLGEVQVDARQRLFEPPQVTYETDIQFGDAFRLLGYELDTQAAHPGGELHLTLVWQAITTPDDNYTVFNHLQGDDGQRKGQFDSPPVGEAWLTETWLPGEVVIEERTIPIEAGATPGGVQLIIGLYEADSLRRLPLRVGGQQQGDQVTLHRFDLRAAPAGG